MPDDRLFALSADDVARIEDRARTACQMAKPGTPAYRLGIDVLRLLEERQRLLVAGASTHAP